MRRVIALDRVNHTVPAGVRSSDRRLRAANVHVAACVVGVTLPLTVAPPVGAAVSSRLDVTRVGTSTGPLFGGGTRLLAHQISPRVIAVRDLQTAARHTIRLPAGCQVRSWGGGRVLLACAGETAAAVDLRTARLTPLPPIRPSDVSGFAGTGYYTAIGRRWARGESNGSKGPGPVYVELATGRSTTISAPPTGYAIDLDAPNLRVPLCDGVAPPGIPDEVAEAPGVYPRAWLGEDLNSSGSSFADVDYADTPPPWRGRIRLQRCHHAPRTLTICRGFSCRLPVLDDRVVAWIETRGTASTHRSTLRVFDRRDHTTRSITLKSITGLQLAHHRIHLSAGSRLLRVT